MPGGREFPDKKLLKEFALEWINQPDGSDERHGFICAAYMDGFMQGFLYAKGEPLDWASNYERAGVDKPDAE